MIEKLFPDYITQYFWGDNVEELDLQRNKKYILQTILERGNQKAIKWLLDIYGADEIKNFLPNMKLSKKSANFWNIYLS